MGLRIHRRISIIWIKLVVNELGVGEVGEDAVCRRRWAGRQDVRVILVEIERPIGRCRSRVEVAAAIVRGPGFVDSNDKVVRAVVVERSSEFESVPTGCGEQHCPVVDER